jgi:hypothetical protein
MKTILFYILFSLLFSSVSAVAQNCASKKIHYSCQLPFDLNYEDSGKSLSFPLYKGKTQKIVMTLAGKKDYYLTVCTESGDQLNLKIRNANNPDEIIFDNSDFKHPQSVEFSMLFASKLQIEVTLPAIYGKENDTKEFCVGLLIYHKDN